MHNTNKLIEWLKKNMEAKNFGVRETARMAGISHPLISDVLKGGKPSYETCLALANLFKTPPEEVLRMASMLPPKPDAGCGQGARGLSDGTTLAGKPETSDRLPGVLNISRGKGGATWKTQSQPCKI